MKLSIPLQLKSLANARMHWRAMAKIKRYQKDVVAANLVGKELPPLPATVTLTRIGKRKMDDDNLAYSFKQVRDQIARTYGVDDGSDKYKWVYCQRLGQAYAIEIEIGAMP